MNDTAISTTRVVFIPELPGDCLESSPVVLDKNDPPRCLVIRYLKESAHPFVVHDAVLQDSMNPNCQWAFHNGNYCSTLERARDVFAERKPRIF